MGAFFRTAEMDGSQMDDKQNSQNPGNQPQSQEPQQNQQPPENQPKTPEDYQAEIDKWKALSRTNEKRWNDASAELEDLRKGQMTDQERALAEAKEEARRSALAEVGGRLVEAEMRAAAATEGVALPSAEYLNLSKFVGADGQPDSDAIKAFVSSLPKPNTGPKFSQDIGLGRQGGSVGNDQLTREDLSNMTPSEITAARKAGKLDALLRGDI